MASACAFSFDFAVLGWSYDDRIRLEDPVRIYSPALHERSLLDANFSDPRILRGEFVGVQNS